MVVEAVPEAKYADVGDGLSMHYHDDGPAEGGVAKGTVVFIHGSGPGASGWSNFKHNYPVLNDAGYRTLVPDTLGYGYSSMPEDGDYGLANLAARYAALIEAAGAGSVTLVGNSQGGAIAIRMALEYPQLVDKLVLMAPGGLEQREVYMEMQGIQAMVKAFFSKSGLTRESMRGVFELQLHDPSKITDALIEERYQIAVTQPKTVISKMKVDNQEDRLSEIACPVLCFWGVDDKFCPVSGAMKVATRCKRSRTVVISACGHWVMVEYPELFNGTLVRFLDGTLG
ncbi:MAG: alpha/beta fold hydrolase [Myxococcales bacterium]|nr:alpha/beta fold hydrolase [Myxococcales bacterium]